MTASGGAVVVALSRAERRLIEGLRRAGAVNAGAARPLEPGGFQEGRLDRLVESGVIREASPGVYYVDETAYERYRQGKRIGLLAIVAAVLLVALFFAIRGAL